MIAESNRPQRVKRTFVSGVMHPRGTRESSEVRCLLEADAWQDALDPSLPAEPALAPASGRDEQRRQPAHKLILKGLVLGAVLQSVGYLAAAHWL